MEEIRRENRKYRQMDTYPVHIDRRPERQREMIHLRDIEGYPIPEIAAITQTDEANVRMTLSRARHKLKQIIEQSTEYGKTY